MIDYKYKLKFRMLNSILRCRANVFPSVLNYLKKKNRTVFSSHIRSSGVPTFTACRCFVSSLPEQHGDLDKEKRLKILMLEVDVLRQEGRKAPNPDLVKPDQWEHLLTLKSTYVYNFIPELLFVLCSLQLSTKKILLIFMAK